MIEIRCNIFGRAWLLKNLFFWNVYISVNTIYIFFFKKHVFQGRLNVSEIFFNLSLKCFLNVSYKFWFTPSPKNRYLQCAQLCLLFFQISSKLNLFFCRDGLSMVLSVCFDVKKNLGKIYVARVCSLLYKSIAL